MFGNLKFGANVITEGGYRMVVEYRAYAPYAAYRMHSQDDETYYYNEDGSVYCPLPRYITVNHKSYDTDRNPKLLEEWKRKMQLKEVVYNPD